MAKKRSPKKKRDHLPALNELELQGALAQLRSLTLSEEGKAAIEAMLRAAANPNAERIDVVIASLEQERRQNVEGTTQAINRVTGSVTSRARRALLEISGAEWNRLVEEANKEK